MSNDSAKAGRAPGRTVTPAPGFRNSLKTRLRISAFIGIAILGAWLAYTVNAVLALYDVTLTIQRTTDLRERVQDAQAGLSEAEEALDRYTSSGQGYDLSRHNAGRTALHMALGAISRRALTESVRGLIQRAEAAEEIYARAADAARDAYRPEQPAAAKAQRDNVVAPTGEKLRDVLVELQGRFLRTEALADERLKESRDAAATAIIALAALILAGLLWLLTDVNRRILVPCAAASQALEDLAEDRTPPRLFDQTKDEIGELGRNFNRAAALHAERSRALAERDIQTSVNAVLAAAATVNDLAGFGTRVLQEIIQVSGAACAVLYLPESDGQFTPAIALGGAEADSPIGREEARRAARERRPIFLSVDPQTPTVNLYDGRILPRESVNIPLVYFDHVVGVLSLGATQAFTAPARNALSAIAPSLAVALANASANERVAEQSRRLAEQNELLEEQRSRIARTAQELQRASALKDRFLASVSHELRTPMTVILGFTGALLRGGQGELNAQQKESLERVQRNARMLLGLINDVLDISKIEAGKMEITRQRIDVGVLLTQVKNDFSETANRKGLTLATEVAPGLEPVTSDPSRLTQIFANLVGNALKFTDKGSILVRAEPRGEDRWALIVADTGIGIPEEEQETIFEEFRQGEPEEHRGRGGTGLGLAIVRKLVLALGGTISLESARGKGTRFTVLLPRDLPSEMPLPVPLESPVLSSARDGQKTVLIVDDDEGVRELLAFELKPHGLKILQASNGQKGLEVARAEKPDAILLDVLMPNLDGWQTLRALKESPETRSIPVVILSVVENRELGISLGAVEHLVKPVDRPALLLALSKAGVLATEGHILVVDDDADVRSLLEQELVAAGYRVRTAAGGAQALELLRRERPSALLLDLMMPPPDGFEVIYRLRQDPELREIPVIIITAKELTASDETVLAQSALPVIRKGPDSAQLIEEVLRAIAQDGAGREARSA
jgi:signal transduction histidine kinase/DNA-binding response OmpR family regulator